MSGGAGKRRHLRAWIAGVAAEHGVTPDDVKRGHREGAVNLISCYGGKYHILRRKPVTK